MKHTLVYNDQIAHRWGHRLTELCPTLQPCVIANLTHTPFKAFMLSWHKICKTYAKFANFTRIDFMVTGSVSKTWYRRMQGQLGQCDARNGTEKLSGRVKVIGTSLILEKGDKTKFNFRAKTVTENWKIFVEFLEDSKKWKNREHFWKFLLRSGVPYNHLY